MTKRLRIPAPGELAPDFNLPATDGGSASLRSSPRPLIITFLRHLA